MWHYILMAAAAVLGIGFAYSHRQDLGLTGSSGSRADSTTWQKVDRSADGFRVEMPSNQSEIQIPAYNESGGADQVNMVFANPDAETTYSIAWEDNPPVARYNKQVADSTLEMARDGAVARTQTTLVSEVANKTQGFPGREFTAKNSGGGLMNSRLIYAGTRLYMLTASFPSEGARRDKDVSRFFNSFVMTKSASSGTGNSGS
jgi:hypothetical protein